MLAELCDSVELELQKLDFFSSPLQESEVIVQTSLMVLCRFDPNYALQYVNVVYSNNPPLELVKQLLGPKKAV